MRTWAAALALALAGCASQTPPAAQAHTSNEDLAAQIAQLEAASGGRLGVALYSQEDGLVFVHRGAERFAMCSTFKTLLAGMVLSGVNGLEPEDRLIIDPAAVEGHAPFTRSRFEEGWMTVGDAAKNIVTVSDNGAANLLSLIHI